MQTIVTRHTEVDLQRRRSTAAARSCIIQTIYCISQHWMNVCRPTPFATKDLSHVAFVACHAHDGGLSWCGTISLKYGITTSSSIFSRDNTTIRLCLSFFLGILLFPCGYIVVVVLLYGTWTAGDKNMSCKKTRFRFLNRASFYCIASPRLALTSSIFQRYFY